RELNDARQLLSTTRLLTLTGGGGVGKTRLALRLAERVVDEYADGICLADLTSTTQQNLVPNALAAVLQVREKTATPLIDSLVEAVRSKHLLLILDNCEHVITVCAGVAATLLRAAPALQILATSREVLGVPGETVLRVPGLSTPEQRALPPPTELADYEAVRLFGER